VHELHEAARAVAALLDLAAVGVEDAVAEVRVRAARALDHQDLVAADAEVAIGDFADLLSGKRKRLIRAIDDDEVVPRPLHLGEGELHALRDSCTQAKMRSIAASSSSGLMGSESTLFAAASLAGRDSARLAGSYAGWRCSGIG
jgi:hypothetical protein